MDRGCAARRHDPRQDRGRPGPADRRCQGVAQPQVDSLDFRFSGRLSAISRTWPLRCRRRKRRPVCDHRSDQRDVRAQGRGSWPGVASTMCPSDRTCSLRRRKSRSTRAMRSQASFAIRKAGRSPAARSNPTKRHHRSPSGSEVFTQPSGPARSRAMPRGATSSGHCSTADTRSRWPLPASRLVRWKTCGPERRVGVTLERSKP